VSNIVREVPTTGGGLAYQVGTRNAATVLRLKDGETQVLAGLIQDEERSTASKLPGFGDLPVLGRLFSSNLDTRGKTEIVLLITPRIVRNLAREGVKTEFFSGTEAAIGERPLVLAATGPGALSLSGSAASGAAGAPVTPPVMQAMASPATLSVVAPAQASVGKEMMVSVTLLPHAAAASAQLELVYDPALLAPVGAKGEAAGGAGSGTVPLELAKSGGGVARAEARFRVIAKSPGSMQVRAENVVVRDAAGGSVPVALPLPQTVNITE
jgi:general secretion pathway protein D